VREEKNSQKPRGRDARKGDLNQKKRVSKSGEGRGAFGTYVPYTKNGTIQGEQRPGEKGKQKTMVGGRKKSSMGIPPKIGAGCRKR